MTAPSNIRISATFSPDRSRTYRYIWEAQLVSSFSDVTCTFVMLNPSKADEESTDQTINICRDYAFQWGCGTLRVVNLFAYRETDPKKLLKVREPVGPDNDRAILDAVLDAPLTVCAWGDGSDLVHTQKRAEEARKLLEPYRKRLNLYCLGLNKGSNEPKHPRRARMGKVVALEPYEPWNQKGR